MKRKKAFTLIELLVVIAIIAILAAILFPVFAQAKLQAKKTAELSNEKQLMLATLMYANDTDDVFPTAAVYDFITPWNTAYWSAKIDPYVKSQGLFDSTLDSLPSPNPGGFGPWISFSANALFGGGGPGGSNPFLLPINTSTGIFGVTNAGWNGSSWFHGGTISGTAVTQPAQTIAFAPAYNTDALKLDPCCNWVGGNSAYVWPTQVMLWDYTGDDGDYYQGWGSAIPDGTRHQMVTGQSDPYPNGLTGGVSINTTGIANFAFSDGHAKSMHPIQTNPDGFGQPQNNMWNSKR